MKLKILALTAALAAVLGLSLVSAPSASATAPFLSVSVQNIGSKTIPVNTKAQNLHQSNATISITSLTPGVCTVPPNSTNVPAYGFTPTYAITLVGKGTCTIRAAHGADVTDRSYVIT